MAINMARQSQNGLNGDDMDEMDDNGDMNGDGGMNGGDVSVEVVA